MVARVERRRAVPELPILDQMLDLPV
jgi:hypothetical protein